MPFKQVNQVVDAAVNLMQQAIDKLVLQGVAPVDAETRVKNNFLRINNTPSVVMTIEELCK